jgi:hypothetical protein
MNLGCGVKRNLVHKIATDVVDLAEALPGTDEAGGQAWSSVMMNDDGAVTFL